MPFEHDIAGSMAGDDVVRRKQQVFLELAIGYGLILLVIWTPRPWQRWFFLSALAWIILVTVSSFEGWKALGFLPSNQRRSYWVVGAALLIATVSFVVAGRLGTLHFPPGPGMFFRSFAGYGIWAFLQQFLLQDFVLLRLLRLLRGRSAAVITAAMLFGVAHLPSAILTPVTLLWGLVSCRQFLSHRNIYPLAISHAIFGICIAITVPGTVDHNMRVGLGYLTYRPHQYHRSQIDHAASTVAWVIADAPIRLCRRQARP